jgi:peptidoglycan/LPS O-acetylase OafA/YrhL
MGQDSIKCTIFFSMKLQNAKLPYIIAIIAGLISPLIPDMGIYPIPIAAWFFISGSLLGYLSPKESWRWGIWLCGPILALTGLSVLFAGNIDIFLKKDLPLLLLAFLLACLGSLIFSRIKNGQTKR